jgi:hypothetical protein
VTRFAGIGRRRWAIAAALAVAIVAVVAAPASRADGDPASDVLVTRNVFLPYEASSASVGSRLESAVSAVYQHGDRLKVAAIYAKDDLGSIPSLYGQPSQYAQFLGMELRLWYVGPLLVVMPGGFGIYDGGRPTSAEQQVLRSLSVANGSPDDLLSSATTAVEHLEAAGALHSADIRAPFATAYPATATRGKDAALHFDLYDDSGRASALIRVYENGSLVATRSSPMAFQIGTRHAVVRWQVPKKLKSRQLRFCVVATDPAGNHSKPSCAPFLRVS